MLNSTIGLPCATSWLSPPAIESPVIEVATPSAPDAIRSCTIFSSAAGSKPGVPTTLTLTPRSLPASRAACSTCLMNGLPTKCVTNPIVNVFFGAFAEWADLMPATATAETTAAVASRQLVRISALFTSWFLSEVGPVSWDGEARELRAGADGPPFTCPPPLPSDRLVEGDGDDDRGAGDEGAPRRVDAEEDDPARDRG